MRAGRLLKVGCRYLFNKRYRFLVNAAFGKYDRMEDRDYLCRNFAASMGQKLDLNRPVTFNEKLQWLKLHDRKPVYTVMADKVRVKEYVAEKIGSQYIIPTLGVWDSPKDIPFRDLPDKFVIKCNHNSGCGMCICKEKARLDISKVKKDLEKGLRQDYYLSSREWPYKDIPRKILAEQYLENSQAGGLTDYKFHCFNGVPQFVLVCRDRFGASGLTEDFYTPQWERMPVKRPKIPNGAVPAPKPEGLEEMLALAEKLSQGIPFVRVDFYFVEGKIYFSELTFFPASGLAPFDPPQWDKTFGDWLVLPAGGEKAQ